MSEEDPPKERLTSRIRSMGFSMDMNLVGDDVHLSARHPDGRQFEAHGQPASIDAILRDLVRQIEESGRTQP
jgi:hypothetical protein